MQSFELYLPTKVVFGPDTESKIARLCLEQGAKKIALIYGGQSAIKSGLIANIETLLKGAELPVLSQGGVVPNPRLSKAEEIRKSAEAFGADLVLAVGGGSVIDTAKAVAHGLANPGTALWDIWAGKVSLTKSVPVGVVLTISAAGSEMSNSAVLTNDLDPDHHFKASLSSELNRPKFAVMDPKLTFTLPKYQIAAGAADIFMHTVERIFCAKANRGNHLSDNIAFGLLRDIIKFGPIGVQNPENYEAMSEIMWCGSVSHNNLTGNGGDFAVHMLGHSLSALYDATHGATLTAVWGSWARYCVSEDPERFTQYGREVFGLCGEDSTVITGSIIKTEEWFHSLGMPTNLHELIGRDLAEEEIAVLARNCSWNETRIIGKFKVLGYEDMFKIYKMAR